MSRFLTGRFSGLASELAVSLALCAAAPANALESTVNFLDSSMPCDEFDRLPAMRLKVD